MVKYLRAEEFLTLRSQGIPILDVRSPSEYMHAHLPQAINFPLFDDEERRVIGTIYKQVSRDAAMMKGLDFVGPRMSEMVTHALSISPSKMVAVHCARGGKRSESMGWLFSNAGFQVYLLEGGYKAIRNYYLEKLEKSQLKFVVLGGMTGSRKTVILKMLRDQGEQILDLEGLAGHKGSAFGHLGQVNQPGYESFENQIADSILQMNPRRIVWIEAESRHIGRLMIPKPIWVKMTISPMILLDVPLEQRLQTILEEYGSHKIEGLEAAFRSIRERIGPQHADAAMKMLQSGDIEGAARIALIYYDKHYAHHRTVDLSRTIYHVQTNGTSQDALIRELLDIKVQIENLWI